MEPPVIMTATTSKYKTTAKFSGRIDCTCKNRYECHESIMKPGKRIPKEYCPAISEFFILRDDRDVSVEITHDGNIYLHP